MTFEHSKKEKAWGTYKGNIWEVCVQKLIRRRHIRKDTNKSYRYFPSLKYTSVTAKSRIPVPSDKSQGLYALNNLLKFSCGLCQNPSTT